MASPEKRPYESIALVDLSYVFAVNWHANVGKTTNNAAADWRTCAARTKASANVPRALSAPR